MTTRATAVEIESTRVTSSDQTNVRNWRPSSGSPRLSPASEANVRRTPRPAETNQMSTRDCGQARSLDAALGVAALRHEERREDEQSERHGGREVADHAHQRQSDPHERPGVVEDERCKDPGERGRDEGDDQSADGDNGHRTQGGAGGSGGGAHARQRRQAGGAARS